MTRDEAKTEINNYGYTISEQNKIIDDIYDYFESRTCENCICWDSVEFSALKTISYCRFLNVGTKNTFRCSEWESK